MNTNILVISGTQHVQEIHNNNALAAIEHTITSTASQWQLSATHTLCQNSNNLQNALADAAHYAGIIIDTGTLNYSSAKLTEAIIHTSIPCIQVITDHKPQPTHTHTQDVHSNISSACVGVVGGFGTESYALGIAALSTVIAKS